MNEPQSVIIYFSNGKSMRDKMDNIVPVHTADMSSGQFMEHLRSGKVLVNIDSVSCAHRWHKPDDDDM